MAIEHQRMGDIALIVLVARMKREGLSLSNHTLRDIGSLSKETGVSVEDLQSFMIQILPEFIGMALGCKDVTVKAEIPQKFST